MSFIDDVGVAVQTRGEVNVEWKIKDFSLLSDEEEDFYRSPVFTFNDLNWYLSLHPNGNSEKSSGWMSLFLNIKKVVIPEAVYCTFGIKGCDGVERKEEFEYEFSKLNEGYGYPKFWQRTKLMDRKSILLPDDMLTVTCDLRSNALRAVVGEKKLGKSLLNVLECGEDCDVVMKVQGKEFPAHKLILRARSPVFRSMFDHDTAEKRTNVITIEDGDPETFKDFLVHIYSGDCDNISEKNVFSLYIAADKYDFGELKQACTEFMKSKITVACFFDVITLAVKYDEKELFQSSEKFFCDHALAIVKTTEWQTLQKENLTLGNELIIKLLSKDI